MRSGLVFFVLGCFLVIGSIRSCGVDARDTFFTNGSKQADAEVEESKNSSEVAVKGTVVVKRCKSKKLNLCDYYFSPFDKTKNATLDDKRVVPTGPNPLHNR
ncbi:hypothetical protein IFM89_029060 [Coptis chinensis]|uniref:Uncharacterized protein n=1 Tax=Coptis chinensis TaxID=261450 RepID=A0A835M765_9MAGN|nr:hypothetical protein IFM89_029060 [Coptis chinensis]